MCMLNKYCIFCNSVVYVKKDIVLWMDDKYVKEYVF